MEEALKSCPFCGGAPVVDCGVDGEGFAECYLQHYCIINGVEIDISICDSNIRAVIATWNTRAEYGKA